MLTGFDKYLKQIGYSGNTILSYERDIKKFSAYLESIGIYNLSRVDASIIADYLKSLDIKPNSMARVVASIRTYFKFALINKIITKSPVDKCLNIKQTNTQHNNTIITTIEFNNILDAIKGDKVIKERDRAIFKLMYLSGFSVTDVINLKVSDVSKLDPINLSYIGSYVTKRELIAIPSEDALFVNSSGDRLTRQGLWKTIKQYKNMAGIDKDVTLHTLRASYIKKQLDSGFKPEEIARQLGFSSVESVKRYGGDEIAECQ